MIYEFVGFPAYEAAVESEIGLLGVLPVDASNELGIRLGLDFISWFARGLWI